MKYLEYGKENEKTIIFLHGIHITDCFNRQLVLQEEYHLVFPHIIGFGLDTKRIFKKDVFIEELYNYILKLNKKVMLVGYGLGSELAFYMVSMHPEVFKKVILISPWLIKDKAILARIYEANLKELKGIKNKFAISYIAFLNKIPKDRKKSFADSIMAEKEETVHNAIYNNISLDTVKEFKTIDVDMLALCGEKEANSILFTLKHLHRINPKVRVKIINRAGDNIPTKKHKYINDLIKKEF